jgi:dihydrofolate synthase/folylpolyglutamate synthase
VPVFINLKNQQENMSTNKTLPQWLEYLESLHPSEIDMGLARVQSVARKMDLLKPAPLIIMVAGTNGKGSTVTMCSSILQQVPMNVGSYMSPHLHIYNERVKINGVSVSDEDLIESFMVIDQQRGDVLLTYFEVGTLSSLYLFKKHKVDAAVLEVGLGGRLDAVNIVDPDISVVTSIGLDHQDWLGHDLASIAFEKAGIFRSKLPAICGERQPQATLVDHAASIAAPLYIKGQAFNFTEHDDCWDWNGLASNGQSITYTNLPLPSLPIENAATVLQVLQFITPQISLQQIRDGLVLAQLAGRMQQVSKPFNAILDVGHNPQAAQMLASRLAARPIKGKRYALLAMLNDKDPEGVVSSLAPLMQSWHLAGISGFRGQSVVSLHAKVKLQLKDASQHDDVEQALDSLLSIMQDEDELIVLGSFITVAKAENWIKEHSNG